MSETHQSAEVNISPGSALQDPAPAPGLTDILDRWSHIARRVVQATHATIEAVAAAKADMSRPRASGEAVLAVPVPGAASGPTYEIKVSDDTARVWSAEDKAIVEEVAVSLGSELGGLQERHQRLVAEERLHFSEEVHRALAEATSQIVWVSDAAGRRLDCNPSWEAFTGQAPDHYREFGWLDAIHPDDAGRVKAIWSRKTPCRKINVRYRLRHKTSAWRWMTESAVALTTPDGHVKAWAGVTTDNNEQQREERRRQSCEAKYCALVNASAQVVWTMDANARVDPSCWHSWCQFTGQSYDDWDSRRWLDAVHPDDQERIAALWSRKPSPYAPTEYEYRLRHASGEWRWIVERVVPLPQHDGHFDGWVGMSIDVSDQRQAEIRVKEHERHLRLALRAAGMAAWSLDLSADRFIIEDESGLLGGLEPIGKLRSLLEIMSATDADKLSSLIAEAQYSGQALYFEFPLRGQPLWLSISGHCATEDLAGSGLLRGVICNITERKLAEERRNLLIGEIAHRGKNLLAVVQSIAAVTLGGGSIADEPQRKFVNRLASLARSHSLLTDKEWAGVPLDEIVRLEFGDLCERATIDVIPSVLNPSAAQNCSLVLHELVTNAVKYGSLSTSEGRVEVRAELAECDDEECIRLSWKETGGPLIAPPTRKGFGSMLLHRLMRGFDTPGKISYEPDGLRVEINMPLDMVRPTSSTIGSTGKADVRQRTHH